MADTEFSVIPGFAKYTINKEGKVFSSITSRLLKWYVGKNGYAYVTLRKDGKSYPKYIHDLVLSTFVGPRVDKQECRHLDGNKTNNSVDNLCWGSAKQNGEDRVRHGTASACPRPGESNPYSKLTENDVRNIRRRYRPRKTSYSKLGKEYGVSKKAIILIVKRINWAYLE